jgi:hypothetical protein
MCNVDNDEDQKASMANASAACEVLEKQKVNAPWQDWFRKSKK